MALDLCDICIIILPVNLYACEMSHALREEQQPATCKTRKEKLG
jgi:hypothetical protein